MKFLDNTGIHLDSLQGKTTIYFKLGLILGDNLGLHSLFGFIEGFTGNYACRFCKMDTVQRSYATLEGQFFLCTVTNYENDSEIANPSLTGMKERCCFNGVCKYHVMLNLCCNIMHDMLGKICKSDMTSIMLYFIENKFFTYDDLINRMKNHNYGIIDSDHLHWSLWMY